MKAIIGGSIGNLVEWYDWYAYAAFALYFSASFFPTGDATAQLLNTAGVTISNQTQLVNDLNGGTKTRAQVLRIIAESPEVDAKFYKNAFVTMEYFGYLRRDPEPCWNNPNPAQCGYIFHNERFKLTADKDFLENTIVRGFIESPEYISRF